MSELILSRLTSLEEAMECQKCGAVEEWETCTGEGENVLSPHFFIGRWSVGSSTDLANIINRNIYCIFTLNLKTSSISKTTRGEFHFIKTI